MSGGLQSIIDSAAQANGLDPAWLAAINQQESGGRYFVTSPQGAEGTMQMMPATAAAEGVSNPYDPAQAIPGGAKLLAQNLKAAGGNPAVATAMYFAGPDRKNWGPKTVQYVNDVAKKWQEQKQSMASPAQSSPGDLTLNDLYASAGVTGGAAQAPQSSAAPAGSASTPGDSLTLDDLQASAQAPKAAPGATPGAMQQIGAGIAQGSRRIAGPAEAAVARGIGDVAHLLGAPSSFAPGQYFGAHLAAANQQYQDQYGNAPVLSPVNAANIATQGVGGAAALATGEGLLNGAARGVTALAPDVGPVIEGAARFLTGRAGQFSGAGAKGVLTKVGSMGAQGAAQVPALALLTGQPVTPGDVALGAVASPLIGGAGSLAGTIIGKAASAAVPVDTRAARAVLNAADADGGIPAASGAAPGDTLATTGGPNVQGLAENLANRPGTGRNIITGYFQNLMDQQPQALAQAIKGAMGSDGKVSDLVANVMQQRSAQAAPLFAKLSEITPTKAQLQKLMPIIQSPEGQAALQSGLTTMRRQALAQGQAFNPGQMGLVSNAPDRVAASEAVNNLGTQAEGTASSYEQALNQELAARTAYQAAQQAADAAQQRALSPAEFAASPQKAAADQAMQAWQEAVGNVNSAKAANDQAEGQLATAQATLRSALSDNGTGAGQKTIVQGAPSMPLLHAVKEGLDDNIESLRDPVTGRLPNTKEVNALASLRDNFRNTLTGMFPEYKAALDAWSGPSKAIDAARLGTKVLSTDTDLTAQRVAAMDPSEKASFQAGVAQAILSKIGQVQDGGKVARMFATPNVRAKVAAAFNSPQEADQFMAMAERLNEQANARNAVMGNSRTALRQAQQGHNWLGTAIDAGANTLAGRPHIAALRLLQGLGNHAASQGSPAYDTALANLLTNPDAAAVAAQLQAARPGAISRGAAALGAAANRTARLSPALLLSNGTQNQ